MSMISPFVYMPFYVVVIYAFITEKEWIRIPCLMWGWGLLLTMLVILREQLYGPYPTKNLPLFLMGYGGYLVMPVVVMLRVIRLPLFPAQGTADRKKKE